MDTYHDSRSEVDANSALADPNAQDSLSKNHASRSDLSYEPDVDGVGDSYEKNINHGQDPSDSNGYSMEHGNGDSASDNRAEDDGKLFLGGLSWDTDEAKLKSHFSKYGQIHDVVVMREPLTSRSRGFGFVHFLTAVMANQALHDEHVIDGKSVDAKKAVPKGSTQKVEKTTKIFVGGIPPQVTESELLNCFSKFGAVSSASLMVEKDTGRPRGFGFVTFEEASSVDAAMAESPIMLGDKPVDIKNAMPRNTNPYQSFRGPGAPFYPRQGGGVYPPRSSRGGGYAGSDVASSPSGYSRYPSYSGSSSGQAVVSYRSYGGPSKYGMSSAPRADPYASSSYGYGSYGYPYSQPAAPAAPSSYGRYPTQSQPRPSFSGYDAPSAPQSYDPYGRSMQQPASGPGYGSRDIDPYGQASLGAYGAGARARYPSRPQQPRQNFGYHPYSR